MSLLQLSFLRHRGRLDNNKKRNLGSYSLLLPRFLLCRRRFGNNKKRAWAPTLFCYRTFLDTKRNLATTKKKEVGFFLGIVEPPSAFFFPLHLNFSQCQEKLRWNKLNMPSFGSAPNLESSLIVAFFFHSSFSQCQESLGGVKKELS